MRSLLLCAALLAAVPAPAQVRNPSPPLASGSRVTLHLKEGYQGAITGFVVGAGGDTLRVVSPALGLAQVPTDALARLEVAGAATGELRTYALLIVGFSAGNGLRALTREGEFVPSFMGTLTFLSAVGGVLYARDGPPRAPEALDVSRGLPGGAVQPGRGAAVRFSTLDRPLARARLTDFTTDSLYLRGGNAPPGVARAEVTRLQVSLGPDRGRGTRIGALAGGVGGGLLGGAMFASGGGDWAVVAFSLGAVVGTVLGGAVGAGTGYVFAPPSWSEVSVTRAP
ncbi:MAG TPA: hypothetical protein VGB66_15460 [Longimicrobium sp.]|jgi:hypothetical protein